MSRGTKGNILQTIYDGRLAHVWQPNHHEHHSQSARVLSTSVIQRKLLDLNEVLSLSSICEKTWYAVSLDDISHPKRHVWRYKICLEWVGSQSCDLDCLVQTAFRASGEKMAD